MCGISGKVCFDTDARVAPELLQKMMDVIAHRGPDGQGDYIAGPVGLGHRRLAIIDLERGDQPMASPDRTVWIVYNGEIYNFRELREELVQKGHRFSTTSDTEVIIHAYQEYGVGCLEKLQGMFAFALWDDKTKTLFLARDRVGIKPLYYCDTGEAVVFGSEIKSLLVDPAVSRELDLESIDRFLTYLYLPSDRTLFRNIRKLEPGCYLTIKDGRLTSGRYWNLTFPPNQYSGTIEQAGTDLWELLKTTVRKYMISDVPVGFLLSGGVDSTALLSCAVHETDKRISTFTIGFDSNEFADERPYARLAAKTFGTDHHEMTISATQFGDFLPKFIRHMEEPVCEAPAIALHYVSQLASRHVKVVLSGEGGDEAFGGYQNYRNLLLLEKLKSAAGPLKGTLGALMKRAGQINGFHRPRKYAPLMTVPLRDYYYSRTSSPFSYFNQNKDRLYTNEFRGATQSSRPTAVVEALFSEVTNQCLLNQMLYVDTKTWLPDDLLVKADKITMANSLELRVPLLDHVVLEFAASLPADFKVRGLTTKRVLKQAFTGRIPADIINRKKTGFPVPFNKWFQGELRDYVRDTLLARRAVERGYFRQSEIESMLNRFDSHEPLAKELFSLLTLELWHQEFVDSPLCTTTAARQPAVVPC